MEVFVVEAVTHLPEPALFLLEQPTHLVVVHGHETSEAVSVGRLGIEPRTDGLKVRRSAS